MCGEVEIEYLKRQTAGQGSDLDRWVRNENITKLEKKVKKKKKERWKLDWNSSVLKKEG